MSNLNHSSMKCLIQTFLGGTGDECFTKMDNNGYNLLYKAQSTQSIEIFKLLFSKLSPAGQAKAACTDKLTNQMGTFIEIAQEHDPLATILVEAALANPKLREAIITQHPTSKVTIRICSRPSASPGL